MVKNNKNTKHSKKTTNKKCGLGMSFVGRKAAAHLDYKKRKNSQKFYDENGNKIFDPRKRKNIKRTKIVKNFLTYKERVRLAELMYCNKYRDYSDKEILDKTELLLGADLFWKFEEEDFANITEEKYNTLKKYSEGIKYNDIESTDLFYNRVAIEMEENNFKLTNKLKDMFKDWGYKSYKKECKELGFFQCRAKEWYNGDITKSIKTFYDDFVSKRKKIYLPKELKLSNYIDKKFFELYPVLNDFYLYLQTNNKGYYNGYFSKDNRIIVLKVQNLKSLNGTFNHELQHLIQYLEGFDGGEGSKHKRYGYSSGEWEARMVKQRVDDKSQIIFETTDYYFVGRKSIRDKAKNSIYIIDNKFEKNKKNQLWVHDKEGYKKRYDRLEKLKKVSKPILLSLENFITNN